LTKKKHPTGNRRVPDDNSDDEQEERERIGIPQAPDTARILLDFAWFHSSSSSSSTSLPLARLDKDFFARHWNRENQSVQLFADRSSRIRLTAPIRRYCSLECAVRLSMVPEGAKVGLVSVQFNSGSRVQFMASGDGKGLLAVTGKVTLSNNSSSDFSETSQNRPAPPRQDRCQAGSPSATPDSTTGKEGRTLSKHAVCSQPGVHGLPSAPGLPALLPLDVECRCKIVAWRHVVSPRLNASGDGDGGDDASDSAPWFVSCYAQGLLLMTVTMPPSWWRRGPSGTGQDGDGGGGTKVMADDGPHEVRLSFYDIGIVECPAKPEEVASQPAKEGGGGTAACQPKTPYASVRYSKLRLSGC
jgi:hypothetical protein